MTRGRTALWLLAIVLVGALLRGLYLLWPYLDSDIAVVGLMARHALAGEFYPLYWGNHYGGSLESLAAAGLFAVFGSGPRALNATAALISLSYLPLLYLLGKEVIGRRAGLVAAFLAALGPYLLVAYSVVARGLHVEMLPLGALLLWLTVRLLKAGPTAPGQSWALLAWGLIAGMGVWTSPLFVYFLPPTLFLLLYRAPRLPITPRFWLMVLAALLGAAPLIYHNWLTGGGTLHYMEIPRPHSGFFNNLSFLLRQGLPAAVGATWFKKDWVLPYLGPALALAAGLSLAWALWRWGGDLVRLLTRRDQAASGGEVLLLTLGCVAYVFCAVGGADSGSFRYLLALYLIWPLVAALAWDTLFRRGWLGAGLGWLFLALVAVGSLWGTVAFSPLNHAEQRAAAEQMGPEQASLTKALRDLGIRYAYVSDYWLGMKATFLADEQVVLIPFDHERHPAYKQSLLRAPPLRGGDAGRVQCPGHPPEPGHGGGHISGEDRPAPLAHLLRPDPAQPEAGESGPPDLEPPGRLGRGAVGPRRGHPPRLAPGAGHGLHPGPGRRGGGGVSSAHLPGPGPAVAQGAEGAGQPGRPNLARAGHGPALSALPLERRASGPGPARPLAGAALPSCPPALPAPGAARQGPGGVGGQRAGGEPGHGAGQAGPGPGRGPDPGPGPAAGPGGVGSPGAAGLAAARAARRPGGARPARPGCRPFSTPRS